MLISHVFILLQMLIISIFTPRERAHEARHNSSLAATLTQRPAQKNICVFSEISRPLNTSVGRVERSDTHHAYRNLRSIVLIVIQAVS